MIKEVLTETINTLVSEFCYSAKKYGPDILLGTGIVGVVTGTVLACRATLKAKEVVEEATEAIEEIHEEMEGVQTELGTVAVVPTNETKKKLTSVYAKTGVKLVKLYAPAIIIEGLGIASIVSSHKILNDRYIGAAAACTALTRDFSEYRKRIAKKFGATTEEDILKGREEVEETVTDEKGKKKKIKKVVKTGPELGMSNFDRKFKSGCHWWSDNHELGVFGLQTVQKQMIERQRWYGHVFLNEVYDELGFPRTKAGNIYGWYYDRNDPHRYPLVDFGIMDGADRRAFLNYDTEELMLHFNCIDILSGLSFNERIDDAEPEVA